MEVLLDCSFDIIRNRIDYKITQYSIDEIIPIHIELNKNKNNNIIFDLELIKKYINDINILYPKYKFDFKISYKMEKDFILDTDECKELEKIDNYLRTTLKKEVIIEDKDSVWKFGFRKTLNANRKLNIIADKIKKTNLSNFEKFMLAHDYVTNFVYNEGGDIHHKNTNYWIPVLEGDKITCGGYSSLLEALCNKIFDPKDVKVLSQTLQVYSKKEQSSGLHSSNLIFIKDEKYNIDGLFYIDSCWDSTNEKKPHFPLAYCCIPLKDLLYEKNNLFKFGPLKTISHIYLSQFEEYLNFYNTDTNSIDELIKNFLSSRLISDSIKDYCLNRFEGIVELDYFPPLTKEEMKELSTHANQTIEKLSLKYAYILDKFNDIKISPNDKNNIVFYKIQPLLNILEQNECDEKELIQTIEKIGLLLNEQKEYLNASAQIFKDAKSFKYYISNILSIKYKNQKLHEIKKRKEKLIEKDLKNNVNIFMTNLNTLANSNPIPIVAFKNSFKIIGKQKGLEGKELEEYIKNRLIASIKRTQKSFFIEKCTNCFANAKIEDIEKGVIKIR